jgi:hypothetical protein
VPMHRSHPAPRGVMLVLLILLALLATHCTPGSAPAPPEGLAASCGTFDARPVRRVTYTYSTAPFQKDPFGGGKYIGKLLMDDTKPELDTDDTWARAVHRNVRAADQYFRNLQAAGYGAWDGCYGEAATLPMVTSVVHHPSFTGFQGKPFSEIYFTDKHVTQMAVTHELAHGVVERTAPLEVVDIPLDVAQLETAAIWESLSDTFAALMTDSYEVRDINGLVRSLHNPPDPDAQDPGLDHTPVNLGLDKYANAGVLNKAVYLMVKGDTHPVAVTGIGKSRVERIYFHALNRDVLKPHATFAEFAAVVINSCKDLAQSSASTGIRPSDCVEMGKAFSAVGISPAELAGATPTVVPTPRPTLSAPTSTPQAQLLQQEACILFGNVLTIENLTRWPVRFADECTGCPQYIVVNEEYTIDPGETSRLGNMQCLPCTVELAVEGKRSVNVTLPGPRKGYCFRVTLRDSDFR